ncbi:pseudo histidine-containing phosphotransfer protein 5-like [Malania oleifera]|uniref:pseudo histidine-containing phosphotransfer protein 5-like n=1 Tax=Malania oleifera TaxID=397392 RepID=UPI0025ADFF2D|nr:pseudo histidine-containing phosphotransfer protein 5-like [Malania oleifera]
MENNPLRQQVARIRQSLFDEGLVDKQFVQLEQLEDSNNPNFVEEIVTMFFRDSTKLFATVDEALSKTPLDIRKLERFVHQFKGSSASIGACKLRMECDELREYCKQRNVEGCKASFERMKGHHEALRNKLEAYFQMARQAGPSETAQRPE